MHTIAELNMLVRTSITLPDGLKPATDKFREGWEFVRSFNACRMEKQIGLRGWNFIRITDGSLRSGVGATSQEAIASALKLALRRISEHFNAVEVEHIELTQYPWFFLARVRVYPFRIQQGKIMPVTDEAAEENSVSRRVRRLPNHAEALYPDFGSAMPQLKQMLISSRIEGARPE